VAFYIKAPSPLNKFTLMVKCRETDDHADFCARVEEQQRVEAVEAENA